MRIDSSDVVSGRNRPTPKRLRDRDEQQFSSVAASVQPVASCLLSNKTVLGRPGTVVGLYSSILVLNQ
jgi:hypothetical protein